MYKNYLKVALRHLWRNKIYTLINIAGLSLGITCAMIIFIFLDYEFSFDHFHSDASQTYRVIQHNQLAEGSNYRNTTAYPLAAALQEDFPELKVSQTAGLFSRLIHSIDKEGRIRRFKEDQILFVSDNYLEIFDFKGIHDNVWLEGNPKTALKHPEGVVLCESTARRYFPREMESGKSILNQVLHLNNNATLMVTGVIKDLPKNTSLAFEMLVSYKFFKKNNPYPAGNWSGNYAGTTFIQLPEGASPEVYEEKIARFKKKHLSPEDDQRISYFLQALPEIHTETLYGSSPGGYVMNSKVLWGLASLAIFLLIIAGFNFINLSTAQATKRSKEVGIRKVVGGKQHQIFGQFMGEVLVLCILSWLISMTFLELMLNYINSYLVIIQLNLSLSSKTLVFSFILMLILAISAGFYPSLVLARYSPLKALHNKLNRMKIKGFSLRKGLITFQFGLAYLLIFGTIVIASQMQYFQQKDLGFSKDAIITVNIPRSDSLTIERFRQELEQYSGIQRVSYATGPPMMKGDLSLGTTFRLPGEGSEGKKESEMKVVDFNYLDMYDLELVAGEWLSEKHGGHRFKGFVVNETLVNLIGLSPEEALGTVLTINEGEAPIVGIVADFHNYSLKEEISPCILMNWGTGFFWELGIQLNGEQVNIAEALGFVQKTWKKTFPDWVYQYEILEDALTKNYFVEILVYDAFRVFAGIAIFISCLGLFGLVAYTVEQRNKEIGIRKVMGASVSSIITLLSQDFLKLVGLAGLIALPISWFLMQEWLANFPYRIHISWWMFALAVFLAVAVAMMTIMLRAYGAANLNPVDVLKDE